MESNFNLLFAVPRFQLPNSIMHTMDLSCYSTNCLKFIGVLQCTVQSAIQLHVGHSTFPHISKRRRRWKEVPVIYIVMMYSESIFPHSFHIIPVNENLERIV